MRGILKASDRVIVFLATYLFADSSSQVEFLRDQKVSLGRKIHVFGDGSIAGVDLNRFTSQITQSDTLPIGVPASAGAFIFLFVGRYTRDKGVFDLLAAFKRLETMDGDGVKGNRELWFVGPDDENIMDEMIEIARQSSFPVRFLENVKDLKNL